MRRTSRSTELGNRKTSNVRGQSLASFIPIIHRWPSQKERPIRTFASSSWASSDPEKSRAAIRLRDRDRYTIAFCDGHVEAIQHDRLFSPADHARRRWNRDNEP